MESDKPKLCVVCFGPRGEVEGLVCAGCDDDHGPGDHDERDPMLDDYGLFHE